MMIEYTEIGICGLSCRLCPNYHMDTQSRCLGCKSKERMAVGCPFITCAIKKKEVEFCWECGECADCPKWGEHRAIGARRDSFKCYQKLNEDIAFIQAHGVVEFQKMQKVREQLLRKMLQKFNEGRSKSSYCVAATVFAIDELEEAIRHAEDAGEGLEIKEKSKLLHSTLDKSAAEKGYYLKLRK